MKKFSVIIPAYNVERYIAATIQSVLNQTYQNFEIIIVDDASPDRVGEICQRFTDPRIKLIRQENRGVSGALNTGIRQAQGEYLAFLDGDDLWLPEKLEKHIEHLEKSPDVGVSFSRSSFIDDTGQPLNEYQMPKLKEITVPYLFCTNPVGNGSAAVVRRETLEAIKFQDNLYGSIEDCYFDECLRACQDSEILLRIAIQTPWQIEGIPEALTQYRVKPGGLSSNFLKSMEVWEQVIERTRSYAPEIVRAWENKSRAYQLRYLARTAVRLRDGSAAVNLINQALASYWRIVVEEPRPTVLTGVAAYLLWLMPRSLYRQTEAIATKITSTSQRQRILQDQSGQSV
jgi:glycosyltransferase involved in cell wall biosynthesis